MVMAHMVNPAFLENSEKGGRDLGIRGTRQPGTSEAIGIPAMSGLRRS